MPASIGICGGGKMGKSFFDALVKKDFSCEREREIRFLIRNPEVRRKISAGYQKTLHAKAKRNGIEPDRLGRALFVADLAALGECDLVFEFIDEDLAAKKELIGRIINVRKNTDQIIATGSSSLVPGKIREDYHERNLIGVHYIYPVQYTGVAEVIIGTKTPVTVVEKVKKFLHELGKKAIVMDEETGCITTKVLTVIHNQAFFLSREFKVSFRVMDELIRDAEFTLPPFMISDTVGHETIYHCILGHYEEKTEFRYFQELLTYLRKGLENGSLGKKSQKGFYDSGPYDQSGEPVDKKATESILQVLKALYINSCLKVMNRCLVDTAELDEIFRDLNQVAEGPVELAYKMGLDNLIGSLKKCEAKYGTLFTPAAVLSYACEKGLGRDEIDRAIRDFKMGGTRPGWSD